MSRLIDGRGLVAAFRIAPSSVPLDAAPRLLAYCRIERPGLVEAVTEHFLTRLPRDARERAGMASFLKSLDDRARATPLALAMLVDCANDNGPASVH